MKSIKLNNIKLKKAKIIKPITSENYKQLVREADERIQVARLRERRAIIKAQFHISD